MAPLATTRSIIRRLADPDRPRIAVGLMVLASSLLFAAVLVALPSPAEGTDSDPVIDVDTVTSSTELISAPSELVLAMPRDDHHRGSVIVNHRRAGVEVTAKLANGTGLSVDLTEAGPRATNVTVSSEAVHLCGRYAGTLILQASAPDAASDVVVLDVRYAECGEAAVPTMAPDSVNDTSPTWADEGRAPWKHSTPSAPAPPPPPPPAPEPQPQTAEAEAAPAPTTEDSPSSESGPVAEVLEPEPEPTSESTSPEPEPEPTSSDTSSPEPEPTATNEPTSDPTTSEPTASETTTSGTTTTESTSTETTSPSPTASSTSG